VQDKERKEESAAATRLGYTEAKLQMLLGQSGANLDALEQKAADAFRDAGDQKQVRILGRRQLSRDEERRVNGRWRKSQRPRRHIRKTARSKDPSTNNPHKDV